MVPQVLAPLSTSSPAFRWQSQLCPLNLTLLAIAYKIVGKQQFVLGTIFGCTMMSVFLGIFQPLLASGFTDESFLNIVIGGVAAGLGVGLAFTHNGSRAEPTLLPPW